MKPKTDMDYLIEFLRHAGIEHVVEEHPDATIKTRPGPREGSKIIPNPHISIVAEGQGCFTFSMDGEFRGMEGWDI
jgi:hypothetical protein